MLDHPPTAADIPGVDGKPVPERKEKKAGLKDILTAPTDVLGSLLQNTAAMGVSGPQALIEGGVRKVMGKDANVGGRFEELMQQRGYQTQNPASQKMFGGMEELNRQVLTPLGPAGIVGMGALTGVPSQVAQKGAQAGKAVGEAASSAVARPMGAIREGVGTMTGKTARAGEEALHKGIQGEVASAMKSTGQKAGELEEAAYAPHERAIASTRATVKSKLSGKAEESSQAAQQHFDELAPRAYGEEELGSLIQQSGTKNVEKLKGEAQQVIRDIKDPAFDKARERAAAGDTLNTNAASKPLMDEAVGMLEQQIADVPEGLRGEMQKRIKAITGGENRPLSEADARVEQLRASVEGRAPVLEQPPEGLTLHQAEYLRRMGNDPILRKNEGFGALDSVRMKDMAKKIEEAMKAYEPDVGRYLSEYKGVKQREDVALGGAYGESALGHVAGEGADEILRKTPTEVARYYLKGDEASAKKLINLAGGKTPELEQAVRGHLRGKMEGMTGEQAKKFAESNQGLLNAFPEAKPIVQRIVDAKTQGEKYTGMASKELGRAEKATSEVKKVEQGARSEAAKQRDLEKSLKLRMTEIESSSPQNSPKVARGAAKQLAEKGLITEEQYAKMLSDIDKVETTQGKTEKARNSLKYLIYGALGMAGGSTVLRHL